MTTLQKAVAAAMERVAAAKAQPTPAESAPVAAEGADAPEPTGTPEAEAPAPSAATDTAESASTAPEAQEAAPEADAPKEDDPTQGKPPAKTWGALFKAQRQVREREVRLTATLEQMKAREAEVQARADKAQRILDDLKADPVAFLERQNISYDAIAKRALNKGAPDPMESLQEKIARLEAGQAEREKKLIAEFEAKQAQAEQNARSQAWIENLDATLKAERFKPIDIMGARDEVIQLQVKMLQQHNRWLQPSEAADMILAEVERTMERAEKAGYVTRARKPAEKVAVKVPEETGQSKKDIPKPSAARPRKQSPGAQRRQMIQELARNLRWRQET